MSASLLDRARVALAAGPMGASRLMGEVLALPGAPPRVAERIAESLLGRHPEFKRNDTGEWVLQIEPVRDGVASERLADIGWAVVDVETTGGSMRQGHRITEIGVVHLNGLEVGEGYTTLVNPQRSIAPAVIALTGISWEMVRDAPRFADVAGEVATALSGRAFVAHNATFDWRFVSEEMSRAGHPEPKGDRLCTVKLARVLLPHLKRRSLDALQHYFGVENPARHRALGDALATARILARLLGEASDQGYDTWPLLSARLDRRTARARRKRTRLPRSVDFDESA